jgi:acetyl-CoA C-acetyltransferase
VTDGAAAALICSETFLKRIGSKRGSSWSRAHFNRTLNLPAHNRHSTELIERTAHKAYKLAGLSRQDIDIAEVHDCFSVAELTEL